MVYCYTITFDFSRLTRKMYKILQFITIFLLAIVANGDYTEEQTCLENFFRPILQKCNAMETHMVNASGLFCIYNQLQFIQEDNTLDADRFINYLQSTIANSDVEPLRNLIIDCAKQAEDVKSEEEEIFAALTKFDRCIGMHRSEFVKVLGC